MKKVYNLEGLKGNLTYKGKHGMCSSLGIFNNPIPLLTTLYKSDNKTRFIRKKYICIFPGFLILSVTFVP